MAMTPASQGDTANPSVRTVPPAHSGAGSHQLLFRDLCSAHGTVRLLAEWRQAEALICIQWSETHSPYLRIHIKQLKKRQ